MNDIMKKLEYGVPLTDDEVRKGIAFMTKMRDGLEILNTQGFYEFALRDVKRNLEVLERFRNFRKLG